MTANRCQFPFEQCTCPPPPETPEPTPSKGWRPRYRIDLESVARQPLNSQVAILLHLVDESSREQFDRDRFCFGCLNPNRDGKQTIPRRPGALCPALSCQGCWLTHLDQVRGRDVEAADLELDEELNRHPDDREHVGASLPAAVKARYKKRPVRIRDRDPNRAGECPCCGKRATVEVVRVVRPEQEDVWKRVHRCIRCGITEHVLEAAPAGWRPSSSVGVLRVGEIRWRDGRHDIDDKATRPTRRYAPVRMVPGLHTRLWIESGFVAEKFFKSLEPQLVRGTP